MFSEDHIRVIEKNREYYNNLQRNGTLRNISSVTVGEFQKVYNEAIGAQKFNTWCSACVIELIELVYINYEKFRENQRRQSMAVPDKEKVRTGRNARKNK